MSGNIIPVVMPKWGLEMRQGTVQEWLVQEGTRVEVGQPLVDVETDKIANAVEATDAGLLRRAIAQVGDVLPVQALLAVLAEEDVSDADLDAYIAAYEVPAAADGAEDAGPSYEYAQVGDIRVRYARRGPDAGEPVIFIHGFGGDLNNWLFNLDAVAATHPVFALDLPAHGQTTVALPGATLQALAGFVAGFMDAVGIDAAHLVGHSMGGGIAAQLARDAPARVRSLALLAPAGLGQEINGEYITGFINAASRRELKPVAELLFADHGLVNRQLLNDLLKYKRLDGVTEALTELAGSLFANGVQSETPGRQLQDFGQPMLVIWGEDDQVIPVAQADNAPPSARVERLAGAGHLAQMEAASKVNALLKAQLER